MKSHNPESISKPLGVYSHGVEISPGSRTIYLSRQVGISPDGWILDTFEDQADRAWLNIGEILGSAGMTFRNIVKMSTFMVRVEDYPKARVARSKYLGDHRPASSAMVVVALADPKILIEIEVVACA